MQVEIGQATMDMDSPMLGRLGPSDEAAGDAPELHRRLDEDGYLYLPDFLDREAVLAARERILEHMDQHEGLEPGARVLDGVMGQYGKSVHMMGRGPITHDPAVAAVLESPRLFGLYARLFDEDARTFDYKWLRAVGGEKCTGAHLDVVYMGRGSQRLMTCWIPFGDIPLHQGTLAICEGSHRLPGFARLHETYGRLDADRDGLADAWFTKNPLDITERFGGRWLTDDMHAGDIITFPMHTMHMSTTNTTDLWRLSCDVRYQPASEPADPRWVGESPKGHASVKQLGPPRRVEQMRPGWGL